jgi:hypothetical protein
LRLRSVPANRANCVAESAGSIRNVMRHPGSLSINRIRLLPTMVVSGK